MSLRQKVSRVVGEENIYSIIYFIISKDQIIDPRFEAPPYSIIITERCADNKTNKV